MTRRNNLLTHGLSLLWLYVVYQCVAGWLQGRTEWSLCGTWKNGGRQIECRSDGSVKSGSISRLIAWRGSRFIFSELELTSAIKEYGLDKTQWDLVLAWQCGVIRSSEDSEGLRVNHKQVDNTIEAMVKWIDTNQFSLDGVCYTRVEE